MDYKIWTVYHNDALVGQYNLKEDEHRKLFATHKDIEGENINYLNPCWSELVALWYVWKNKKKSSFVGFDHYRRQFGNVHVFKKGWCQVFNVLEFGAESVYSQYSIWHKKEDLDLALEIVDEKCGKDNWIRKEIETGHRMIGNCCFFMSWEDFNNMCEFLFPVLEEYQKRVLPESEDIVEAWRKKAVEDFGEGRATYQMRNTGFIAERLISAWIFTHLKVDV